MNELEALKNKLQEVLRELQETKHENATLKARLCALERVSNSAMSAPAPVESPMISHAAGVHAHSPSADKIALFLDLFRGRDDVYATRWVNKEGKQGYSPACANDWLRGVCGKYHRTKCMDCENRMFLPYGGSAIEDHLRGLKVLGVYPLRPDDTCCFLAADFDASNWQEDVAAFWQSCRQFGVPAAVERSRSGNGAHVWVFFSEPISASTARELGSRLLTAAMERRHQIGLGSYDRLFPNQDTTPKGGFGNLIALPLQKETRSKGNSVFVDEGFQPYSDQWQFLSGVRKLGLEEINSINNALSKVSSILSDLRQDEENDDLPWRTAEREPLLPLDSVPTTLRAIASNMVYIDKTNLAQPILNRIIRLAAFQNPEFYKAQAMRLPTYDKPRIISLADVHEKYVAIPRGCKEQLELFGAEMGTEIVWQDETNPGIRFDVNFSGELRPIQQEQGKNS